MPNYHRCCHEVKSTIMHKHTNCNRTKPTKKLKGRKINSYYRIESLDDVKLYTVCSNVYYALRNHIPLRRPRERKKAAAHPLSLHQERRHSKRLKGFQALPSISHTLKRVVVTFEGNAEIVYSEFLKDLPKIPRSTKKTALNNQLIDENVCHFYSPYKFINDRGKQNRIRSITLNLIGSCIGSKNYSTKGVEYLSGNIELVNDVLSLIDDIKIELHRITEVAMHKIEDVPCPTKETLHELAMVMISESSCAGYSRMRKAMIGELKDLTGNLPSYYMATKDRPKIESFIIDNKSNSIIVGHDDITNINSTDLDVHGEELLVGKKYTPSSFLPAIVSGIKIEPFDKAYEHVLKTNKSNLISAARIAGDYKYWIDLLVKKHLKDSRVVDGKVIIIDSYDGALHAESNKNGRSSIVSFSSQMLSSSLLKYKGVTAGSSLNILTFQQMLGDEKAMNLFPAIENIFKTKSEIRLLNSNYNDRQYTFYELHDGKMLYLLTQHSLFNRLHHPFLLCSCQRGEGVKDPGHKCRILTQTQQEDQWERSLKRWNLKIKKAKGGEYGYFDHMKWVDVENTGCSHFGIHPKILPRNSLRFDIFHLRCAITRRLMTNLRKYIMIQDLSIIIKFSDQILPQFMSRYNVLTWNYNKPFTSFIGSELLAFIKNTKLITDFLSDNFVKTPMLSHLRKGLQLWQKITPFLTISTIEDVKDYEKKMLGFKANLKEFYKHGKISFLTKKSCSVGGDETFYMHCLRFYIPMIAEKTLRDHGLGVGIFTMQGFERRNKESKNVLRRFSNGRQNVCVNNLKRLWDVFWYNHNSV